MKKIYTDPLRTLAWGTDASFYRLIPEKVVVAQDEQDVIDTIDEVRKEGKSLTFRAAGTSLSGQSITDSVLLVAANLWQDFEVDQDQITLEPGIRGAKVNQILAKYGRRFGPDPASVESCMVGGIVANNASGMYCGTRESSDALLTGARIILADSTVLDTTDPASRAAFEKSHPEFIRKICELRDRINADTELAERIRFKYSIKNVTGLNILPFVKFTDPFDIIAHLMVGSEGTLGFISKVKMRTLPLEPYQASAMVYFKEITEAARAVVAIKPLDINTAEMLDSRSLESVNDPTGKGLTALLLQLRASSQEELDANIREITKVIETFDLAVPFSFTSDPATCAKYWKIRSGIFPTVGGMRPKGTTCLIEDVAFHVKDLPAATADLSALLDRFNYEGSCIYGHALEGNFHFIINQSFQTPEDTRRYDDMIHAVTEMVVGKYDGSLKAEHGTGRNMAPFVKYEWGEKAYGLMKEIKDLFDPQNIFNPGVIFNEDPCCHLKHTKALPVLTLPEDAPKEAQEAYERINRCIECGFCEHNCLTCGLTLSSRTRIASMREIEALRRSGTDPDRLKALEKAYRYEGMQSCAADGLCSTSCPMSISVADLTCELRREKISGAEKLAFDIVGKHFGPFKSLVRAILGLAKIGRTILGKNLMSSVCRGLHKMGIPLWTPSYPAAYHMPKAAPAPVEGRLKVVYFPSCLNQMMRQSPAAPYKKSLVDEMIELLGKGGYDVIFPENMKDLCCGEIWKSKGMPVEADRKLKELEEALWKASEQGKYPVLCDQSPCLHRMKEGISKMKLYEPAEFIMTFLKDRLEWHQSDEPVVIHQTCTMRHMGLAQTIVDLARMCSSNVTVPEDIGCCGFAGDKGMTNPEINAYALRALRSQVKASGAKVGYSNSRTCEIGLETNSGIPYVSIAYLVNKCTRKK